MAACTLGMKLHEITGDNQPLIIKLLYVIKERQEPVFLKVPNRAAARFYLRNIAPFEGMNQAPYWRLIFSMPPNGIRTVRVIGLEDADDWTLEKVERDDGDIQWKLSCEVGADEAA